MNKRIILLSLTLVCILSAAFAVSFPYGGIAVVHSNCTETDYAAASNSDTARGTALIAAGTALQNGDVMYLSEGRFDQGTFQTGGTHIDLSIGGTGSASIYGQGSTKTTVQVTSKPGNPTNSFFYLGQNYSKAVGIKWVCENIGDDHPDWLIGTSIDVNNFWLKDDIIDGRTYSAPGVLWDSATNAFYTWGHKMSGTIIGSTLISREPVMRFDNASKVNIYDSSLLGSYQTGYDPATIYNPSGATVKLWNSLIYGESKGGWLLGVHTYGGSSNVYLYGTTVQLGFGDTKYSFWDESGHVYVSPSTVYDNNLGNIYATTEVAEVVPSLPAETCPAPAIIVDSTPPTILSNTLSPVNWHTSDFNVWFYDVNFDISGKQFAKYSIDAGAFQNFDYNIGDTNFGIPITTDGNHTIQAWFRDTAGNDLNISGNALLDKTAPQLISISNPGAGAYQTSDFNIFIDVNFAISGFGDANYSIGGQTSTQFTLGTIGAGGDRNYYLTFSTDGNRKIDYNFHDAAGNLLAGSIYSALDKTAPFTAISGNTYSTASSSNQNITLACIESSSGCHDINYQIDRTSWVDSNESTVSFMVFGDGNHSINFYSTDNVGNSEAIKTSYAAISIPQSIQIGGSLTSDLNKAATPGGNEVANNSGDVGVVRDANRVQYYGGAYTFTITVNNNSGNNNFTLRETIPKQIASDVNQVQFFPSPTRIVQADPIVEWDYNTLPTGTKTITYSVKRLADLSIDGSDFNAFFRAMQKPQIITLSATKNTIKPLE